MAEYIDKVALYNKVVEYERKWIDMRDNAESDAERENAFWKLNGSAALKFFVIDAKPVDVEPVKHGHWMRDTATSLMLQGTNVCSKCCFRSDLKYNYCPECGAKMDGKDDVKCHG